MIVQLFTDLNHSNPGANANYIIPHAEVYPMGMDVVHRDDSVFARLRDVLDLAIKLKGAGLRIQL